MFNARLNLILKSRNELLHREMDLEHVWKGGVNRVSKKFKIIFY
jgi:hypothetical protein